MGHKPPFSPRLDLNRAYLPAGELWMPIRSPGVALHHQPQGSARLVLPQASLPVRKTGRLLSSDIFHRSGAGGGQSALVPQGRVLEICFRYLFGTGVQIPGRYMPGCCACVPQTPDVIPTRCAARFIGLLDSSSARMSVYRSRA